MSQSAVTSLEMPQARSLDHIASQASIDELLGDCYWTTCLI